MVNQKSYSIILCLFSLLLISCSEKIKLNPNSSFGYEDLWNKYDSETGVFMRKYSADTIKIKIILTKAEKEKILQSFSDNGFQDFPNEIDCSKWGFHPKHYDRISLNTLSVNYIYNKSGNEGWFCKKGKKFNRISVVIQDIILNRSEIKDLEPSDIAYE